MYQFPNKISIPFSTSEPISIPTKMNDEQNSLLRMRIVPPQNSPPSLWKMRLNKRVGESKIKKVQNFNPL